MNNDNRNTSEGKLSPEHYHRLTEEEKDIELLKSINRVNKLVCKFFYYSENEKNSAKHDE
jgi:hypothetical protein